MGRCLPVRSGTKEGWNLFSISEIKKPPNPLIRGRPFEASWAKPLLIQRKASRARVTSLFSWNMIGGFVALMFSRSSTMKHISLFIRFSCGITPLFSVLTPSDSRNAFRSYLLLSKVPLSRSPSKRRTKGRFPLYLAVWKARLKMEVSR